VGSAASRKSLRSLSFYNVEVLDAHSDNTDDFTVTDAASTTNMEGADEVESVDDVINEFLQGNETYLLRAG
jgi:hypothetical protein